MIITNKFCCKSVWFDDVPSSGLFVKFLSIASKAGAKYSSDESCVYSKLSSSNMSHYFIELPRHRYYHWLSCQPDAGLVGTWISQWMKFSLRRSVNGPSQGGNEHSLRDYET